MTRRVRSGSSQKHKKMPGNATKWGEFDNQHVNKFPIKKKKTIDSDTNIKKKLKPALSNSSSSKSTESLSEHFFDEDKYCFLSETKELSKEETDTLNNADCNLTISDINNDDSNMTVATNKVKKRKMKQRNFDNNSPQNEKKSEKKSDEILDENNIIKLDNDKILLGLQQDVKCDDFDKNSKHLRESFSQQYEKKKRKKKKNKQNIVETFSPNASQKETCESNSVSFDMPISSNLKQDDEYNSSDNTSDVNKSFQDVETSFIKQKRKKHCKLSSDLKESLVNDETSKDSPSKKFKKKKERHLKNLQKKREELGLLLLPHNSENKLRKLKKRLIEKGLPPEMQKDIMRKARRTEELKHRKIFNPSKLCFNCREAGHVLADCPKKSDSVIQETGICFKCGSVEHTSFKCPKNVQGFPFAKCFICKEQGHISRNCPRNKRGIYPKGGRCNLCGNVNHLRKDCPTFKKKENEEDITLGTISKDASIDAEVVNIQETKIKSKKEAKIVKF